MKSGAAGNGSQSAPLGSIQDAIDLSASSHQPIYVCAGAFQELLRVPGGTKLYGGIDCAQGWKWVATPAVGARTEVTGKANEIPLVVYDTGGTSEIFGFRFQASDAVALKGGSSIAAIAHGKVNFKHVFFAAGDALEGLDAADGAAGATAPLANKGTNHPITSCSIPDTMGYAGGATSTNMCTSGVSTGGAGGQGGPGNGGNAASGANGTINTPPAGNGGKGNTFSPLGQVNSPCVAGTAGHAGMPGSAGAAGLGVGSIDGDGYAGVDGGDGATGENGGGGGGGGGARTQDGCFGGDGGGSGGAGGCGGSAGLGGTAGGSSIAIVVLGAGVTFENCGASVGQAGRGGDGGAGGGGGLGAAGGSPGNPSPNPLVPPIACAGGAGGVGGHGGTGGGGSGGHAVGLACAGTCSMSGLTVDTIPSTNAGAGGQGDGTNDGSAGVAAPLLQF